MIQLDFCLTKPALMAPNSCKNSIMLWPTATGLEQPNFPSGIFYQVMVPSETSFGQLILLHLWGKFRFSMTSLDLNVLSEDSSRTILRLLDILKLIDRRRCILIYKLFAWRCSRQASRSLTTREFLWFQFTFSFFSR